MSYIEWLDLQIIPTGSLHENPYNNKQRMSPERRQSLVTQLTEISGKPKE